MSHIICVIPKKPKSSVQKGNNKKEYDSGIVYKERIPKEAPKEIDVTLKEPEVEIVRKIFEKKRNLKK